MWEDILKGITPRGRKLVESVMTTTPKSINTILADIFKEIDKVNKNNEEYRSGFDVPTRKQLEKYLSINYSKILLSNATKKPVKTRHKATAHYYKEE
mgnify:CR=1 FL=1